MRIGIDVGGTSTDAVLMDEVVVAKAKQATTKDVTGGIVAAVERVLDDASVDRSEIGAVMIGTTHFTNAIVERRRLAPTAVLRLGLPAITPIEPFEDWPSELREAIGARGYLASGGNEFDGREISALDTREIATFARDMRRHGIEAVAIAAVFSPMTDDMEHRAAQVVEREAPELRVSLSHEIGPLGLLERENATAMNASLHALAAETVESFRRSLQELGVATQQLYLTQNDGTLMHADLALRYPVLTFASGPTNSVRGAAFLAGVDDGLVLDVGGTTTDVGALRHGFPRPATIGARVGGVRTNFRMPDLASIGLGGGSRVRPDGPTVGPDSVGYAIAERALVFGGDELTATDVAVAAGVAELGDPRAVAGLDDELVAAAAAAIQRRFDETVDRMKLSKEPEPVVVVGGGSILVGDALEGASRMIRPRHFEAANAVGAAIAQISGEVDRIVALDGGSREQALAAVRDDAVRAATANGAVPGTVQVVDLEDTPVAYMEGRMARIRARAVGDLPLSGRMAPTATGGGAGR